MFILSCYQANGQDLIYDFAHKIKSLNIIDGNRYKEISNSKAKKKLFLNDSPIDSTGLNFYSFLFLKKNEKIYAYTFSKDERRIFFYSFENNAVKKESEIDRLYILNDQYLVSENVLGEKGKVLFAINPLTGQMIEVLNIPKFSFGYEPQEIIHSPDGNRILIQYGEYVGGGSDIYGILEFDVGSNRVEDRTEEFRKILPIDPITNLTVEFIVKRKNEHHLYVETLDGQTLKDELIFDNNFKLVGKSIAKQTNDCGVSIEDGRIISYNVSSETDEGRVIIKYQSTYELEKIFYKIYYDSILSSFDLSLTKQQLTLAKNFIFAKHNFKFDSKYYQAYFNLFEFYNLEEKKKMRIKNVSKLLGDADRKNLFLLNKEIKRKE